MVRNKTTNAINAAKKTSGITPDVILYGTVTYTWYGFTFDISAYYSGLLAIDLTADMNLCLGGATAAGLFQTYPVAIAAGVGAAIYNEWIKAAQEGQYTGNGCTEYFFGTTSSPFLFNVIINS